MSSFLPQTQGSSSQPPPPSDQGFSPATPAPLTQEISWARRPSRYRRPPDLTGPGPQPSFLQSPALWVPTNPVSG